MTINMSPEEHDAQRANALLMETRRQALEIARQIIAGIIADREDEGAQSIGDALLRGITTGDGLIPRTTATLELASWLLDERNPITGAPRAGAEILDRHAAYLVDPLTVGTEEDDTPAVIDIGITPQQAIAHRNALRHLATEANELLQHRAPVDPYYGDLVKQMGGPLTEAVDKAYEALDWPRYPEDVDDEKIKLDDLTILGNKAAPRPSIAGDDLF